MKKRPPKIKKRQDLTEWSLCKKHPSYRGEGKPPNESCSKCASLHAWMNERW